MAKTSGQLPNITHNNHYVPQATLKRWADADGRVNTYALLVPHNNVPVWKQRAPKSIACQLDLYSRSSGTQAEDEFETWLTQTYEEDGQAAIERLLSGARMESDDWRRISMFVAVQQLRTPQAFVEFSQRFQKHLQSALESSVQNAMRIIEESHRTGVPIPQSSAPNHFDGIMRVTIDHDHAPGRAAIWPVIASMRSVWMAEVRRKLVQHEGLITQARWQTLVPADDDEWLLTDHPALNIAYYSPENYDFKAGWGQAGADFVLPVAPRVALYTRIGDRKTGRSVAPRELTDLIQRLLVERAFRNIFTRKSAPWVETLRPRRVDLVQANEEQAMWERWNPEQAKAEAEFASALAPPTGE